MPPICQDIFLPLAGENSKVETKADSTASENEYQLQRTLKSGWNRLTHFQLRELETTRKIQMRYGHDYKVRVRTCMNGFRRQRSF